MSLVLGLIVLSALHVGVGVHAAGNRARVSAAVCFAGATFYALLAIVVVLRAR